MSELLEHLRQEFQNEDARYGYTEAFLNAFVAAQIKTLREDREMSQEKLAEKIGTKQSGISRLENVNYSSWKVETLRKLARAFGVRLRISFEEFGTLLPDLSGFKEKLAPCRFEKDPVFYPVLAGDRASALVFQPKPEPALRSASTAQRSLAFDDTGANNECLTKKRVAKEESSCIPGTRDLGAPLNARIR